MDGVAPFNAKRFLMAKSIANLKEIAALARVSVGTVSRVLHGKPSRIAETTCQRVMEAARKLGYRPNLLVRGIQSGKTRLIGVMAPPYDSYWSEVLYGIHDTLVEADHVPLILWTQHAQRGRITIDPLTQIYRMIDLRVDGVVLWPEFAELYHQHLKEFSSRKMPVVSIDHELPPEEPADFVGSDEELGGRIAAEHLLKLGHIHIAHLAGDPGREWARRRLRAFERAVRESGEAQFSCLTVPENTDGMPEAVKLLQAKPRPTAIFAATDHTACSVFAAASGMGLRIPEDLSVVGCGDLDVSARLSPPLTTLRQQPYAIGREAALLVLRRSQDEAGGTKRLRVELPVELIVRASTARPRPCK